MAYPTRVRYGLRLLVRLALQEESRLSMNEITLEEGVSIKYLEQIVSLLKPLGILESVRGARGGYCLICNPGEITMDRVFESLGGLAASAPCFEDESICSRVDVCTTKPFWGQFDTHVRGFLKGKTLADIVASAPKGNLEFSRKNALEFGCPIVPAK
ncbi:Transcriptional regulator (fragment) [uncultured delta proteobacterium]|uniref:Transcriptional regulator n=1 Tax=uncultured delta proteobacterium TaxID=34034 RepID=A0A212IY01_9DELT